MAECQLATAEEDEGHEDAVLALLGLAQASRLPSPVETAASADPSPPAPLPTAITGLKRRASSTSDFRAASETKRASSSPMPKPGDGCGEFKFTCKYPDCGKSYASTDAV